MAVVCCAAVLSLSFCVHTFNYEEPAFLRSLLYQYTVTDSGAQITGYRGLWVHLCIPATLGGVQVNSVGRAAFENRSALKSVRFGEGVRRIEDGAFSHCGALETVCLPESLTEIGEDAFLSCESLKAISFPNGVLTIGDGALDSCVSLDSLVIPPRVTVLKPILGRKSYYNTRIQSVTIPPAVNTIDPVFFEVLPDETCITVAKGSYADSCLQQEYRNKFTIRYADSPE